MPIRGGLYNVENPIARVGQFQQGAMQSYGSMDKKIDTDPKKTAGGALLSGGSMAAAGFAVGGPYGAAAGAILGFAGYMLS